MIRLGPFPVKIDSLNKRLTRHWSRNYRDGKALQAIIGAFINRYSLKVHFQEKRKRRVKFVSLRSRMLDTDNLIGGFKGVRDAIKRLGVIVDDSPKWLDALYEQRPAKKETHGFFIEVEDCQ